MSYARHREALLAAENSLVGDPAITDLQSKIVRFQQKQRNEAKSRDEYYDRVEKSQRLNDLEAAISKQILSIASSALEYMLKEKEHKELYEACGVDPDSAANAIESLQDDIAAFQMPQTCDLSKDELDAECAVLSKEIKEDRRRVMQLVAEHDGNGGNLLLPQSISDALQSLRTMFETSRPGGEVMRRGEVDALETKIRREYEEAHEIHNEVLAGIALDAKRKPQDWDDKSHCIFQNALLSGGARKPGGTRLLVERLKRDTGKSEQDVKDYLEFHTNKRALKLRSEAASRDLKTKFQEIEERGMKEIQSLRTMFNEKANRAAAACDAELKSKEARLRLSAMRLERDDTAKTEKEMQTQLNDIASNYENETSRAERVLESKQSILRRQVEASKEAHDEKDALRDAFVKEIDTLQHQEANKVRTSYREDCRKEKAIAQKVAEGKAMREEEIRLGRLNSLAASVPYYRALIETEADIFKSTEARKNDVYGGRSKLADFQSGRIQNFTTEKIFSDPKYRLSNAIHEAGIARTEAARDAVRAAIPRTEARTTGIKPY